MYNRKYPKGRFKQDCLAEYARYEYEGERLFRTAGIDFSFSMARPQPGKSAHYASLLPPGFKMCAKVWEEIYSTGVPLRLTLCRRKQGPSRISLMSGTFRS